MHEIKPGLPKPLQGEIWYTRIPTDPPNYQGRPVVIVSLNARNQNDRANTVVSGAADHLPARTDAVDQPAADARPRLAFANHSELLASSITTIHKKQLKRPREKLRPMGHAKIRRIAQLVALSMGILPEELSE